MLDSRPCPTRSTPPSSIPWSVASWTRPHGRAPRSPSSSSTPRPTRRRTPRAALGVELGQIVKSLVFVAPRESADHEPVICLVAGTNRVDLALLAAVAGEPGIRRATAREARELTGFPIGGIPPLGHLGPVRVVMDPDLWRFRGRLGGGRPRPRRLPRSSRRPSAT